jgi:parallel beta-helix repeat protein
MENKLIKTGLITLSIIFASLICYPCSAIEDLSNSDIVYVGGSSQGNYSSIQAAINDVSYGGTVFVYNGTYYENIVIFKSISLIGEDKNSTIIEGNQNGSVVYIIGEGVILTGFTLQNSSRVDYRHAGIEIYSHNCRITNNIIRNNRVGIHPLFAKGLIPKGNHTIEKNIIMDNDKDAICIHCSNNLIINNHIENNGGGIFLQQFARRNKIKQNNLINNTYSAGHYKAIFNIWDSNYWDDWIGLNSPLLKLFPKMIPKYFGFLGEFRKIPWPCFDFRPANTPYEIK